MTLSARLLEACVDWDGFSLPDESVPRAVPTCGELREAATALTLAQARIRELETALDLYREAVRIDVLMEGPKFMGANSSALKRAWDAERALKEAPDV